MFSQLLLVVMCLDQGAALCGPGEGPPSPAEIEALLDRGQAPQVRDLGERAIPALVEIFKQRKHRTDILPILANSKTKLARTAIEAALRGEDDFDQVFWQARALGLIRSAESKPVLLATIKRANRRI